MKVVLLSTSDCKGGAAVASFRLMQALRSQDIDARMLVMNKGTESPYVAQLQPSWRRKAAFLEECAWIYANNGFSREYLFKASAARFGMPVNKHPWIAEADIVVLGWINQGMLSLREIGKIDKPIAWVMHDMWPMTGVCHHAGVCPGFKLNCGNCPLLHDGRPFDDYGNYWHDLSWSVLNEKKALYGSKPMRFVAVSQWLRQRAIESKLLSESEIEIIHNPFPCDASKSKLSRIELGLPESKKLIVMGAARLDDPVKGLDMAIEAMNSLAGEDAAAVFFGELRDPHALDGLRIEYVNLGPISDPAKLSALYACCDVVLSASHYETFGYTLAEGMAAGCVPVTFGQGGQVDIVDHLETGYVAVYPSTADLAQGIKWAIEGNVNRQQLPKVICDRFDSAAIAKKFIALFEEMLRKGC